MNEPTESNNSEAQNLRSLMKREISLMRELLSSMEQEHHAILTNEVQRLKSVLQEREPLIETLEDARNGRIDTLWRLASGNSDTSTKPEQLSEESVHALLTELADNECCEILLLRDQMLALLEKMTTQNSRNNYLLKTKINITRELIHRLHPDDPHKTYSGEGRFKPKPKTTTVAIINQEV